MPDRDLKTVSATQVSALFGVSPYMTEWMLWRLFTGRATQESVEAEENERMEWGRRLEPAIFAAVCERLNIEGAHNAAGEYVRHGEHPIGCTPDGKVWHPSRGPSIVQCKNVDRLVWRDSWADDAAPAHVELQVQHEMLVTGAKWGVIAALVGGNELHIMEREPDEGIQRDILARVERFFERVRADQEPDPSGADVTTPDYLMQLAEADRPEVADLSASQEATEALEALHRYGAMRTEVNKGYKIAKEKLMAMSGGAELVLGHGFGARVKLSQRAAAEIELPPEIKADLRAGNVESALAWRHVTRQAGATVRIETFERETDGPPPWEEPIDNYLMGG